MNLFVVLLVFQSLSLSLALPQHVNAISNSNSNSTDAVGSGGATGGLLDPKNKFRSIKYSAKDNQIEAMYHNKSNDPVSVSSASSNFPALSPQQALDDENSVEESSILRDDLDTWQAPDLYIKSFPYYLCGYDDENRPIWVTEMGRFNVKQVIEQGPEAIAILNKYVKQAAYRILKSLHEQPIPDYDVSEIIYITDFDEMGLFQIAHTPTLMYVMHLARTYKDLMANHMGATIVINANYFAEMLINIIRPVFGRVMEKMEVYGTQQAKWMPVLRRVLPPDTIPTWYGGRGDFKPLKVYG